MSKQGVLTAVFTLIIFVSGFDAYAQRSKQNYEIMRLIRHEKFDHILPGALRDNTVDMWIHVVQDGIQDPLALDLGGQIHFSVTDTIGYYIFTDRGGDRIERAILGGSGEEGLYDISGSERDLREFVGERDPKVIAVNMSIGLPIANGLSHIGYLRMTTALGKKYTGRLISAENVITDFRVRRVQREIIAFADALEMRRRIMEKALQNIKPGITTREDVGWWAADKLLEQGIPPTYQAATLFLPYMPGVSHSVGTTRNNPEIFEVTTTKTGRDPAVPYRSPSYVYQRGDFLSWDLGIGYLNFGTDIKRNAYILQEGEAGIPEGLKLAWERGMKGREIIRKTLKVGRSAGESLENIVRAFENAGFVYTPSDDRGAQYRKLMNALGDTDQSGFSIDLHATGNTSVGDVTAGPSIAPFRPGRARLMVQQNYIFSLEFEINTWIPEWKRRVSINFEDNALVTSRGVEFLYPPNERIIIVR